VTVKTNYRKAEELFLRVLENLLHHLGPHHDIVNRAKLGLSMSLLLQTRRKESTALLRNVYSSRLSTLGELHPRTLDVTMQLAESVLAQGRFTESLELGRQAHGGFLKAYGPHHKKTIECTSLLGLTHFFFFNFSEAVQKHREAIELTHQLERQCEKSGRGSKDAVSELDLLTYEERLASALLCRARESALQSDSQAHLEEAENLASHVVQRRMKVLGRGHPYTLYATAVRARIEASHAFLVGDTEALADAGIVLLRTLTAAIDDEDIGEGHLGVLAGKK
jgi:hypothetical protein